MHYDYDKYIQQRANTNGFLKNSLFSKIIFLEKLMIQLIFHSYII